LVNELWAADDYQYVTFIGEEIVSLSREIERAEKALNNQLQYVQEFESQRNSLQNDGPVEDL
jgi:hypothetical protein